MKARELAETIVGMRVEDAGVDDLGRLVIDLAARGTDDDATRLVIPVESLVIDQAPPGERAPIG